MNLGNVLIADDHPFVLSFLQNLLEEHFEINKITTLLTLSDLNKDIEKNTYDLYILDLEFKDGNCYEVINTIKSQQKKARIIVNTAHRESWHINALLKLNPNSIVLKDSCEKYLLEAVSAVMKGETFLCPNCRKLKYNYSSSAKRSKGLQKEITPKEREILQLIVDGATTQNIADACNISVNTVEYHRKNLIVKLEAENAAHLTAKAIYYQLVELKNK